MGFQLVLEGVGAVGREEVDGRKELGRSSRWTNRDVTIVEDREGRAASRGLGRRQTAGAWIAGYHAAEARLLWQQGSGWQVEGWGAALEAGVPVGMYRSDIGSRGSLSMRPTEACGPAGVGSEGAARHREVSG